MKIMSIVSWVLVAVLAVGVGVMAFMGQKNAGRAAELEETLSTVQADFEASQQELSGAKDALAAAENNLSTAQADSAAQAQKAQEQTARVETLAKDLAAKEEQLTSVTAEMEEAVKQAQEAKAAIEAQKAEWVEAKEDLEAQLASAQAELAATQAAAEAEYADVAADAEGGALDEEGAEALGEDASVEYPDETGGRIVGQSRMFSFISYGEDQKLFFRLLDGQTLTYEDVPATLVEEMVAMEDRVDMRYRFHVQNKFKSLPPDNIVIRKYLKWHRKNPVKTDVRAVIAEPVEEGVEPEVAEAPAEE